MTVECTKGFQDTIASLLEQCVENHTDSITVTIEYDKSILEIDMTFNVKRK